MNTLDAMKQALEALYASIDVPCYEGHPKQEAAYEALRIAIAEMEKAEPVAWLHSHRSESDVITNKVKRVWGGVAVGKEAQYTIPLFTHLRIAIAEMEKAEPVAWVFNGELEMLDVMNGRIYHIADGCEDQMTPLFTHPAQSRDKPNFTDLLKEANEIVKGKSVYKRFMESTPLENDVPVWMADFAMEHGIYQPVEPAQSRDSIIEECAHEGWMAANSTCEDNVRSAIRALKGK